MSRDKQIEEMAKDLLNVSNKVSKIIMEETHEFVSQKHKYNNLKEFHEAHKKGRNLIEAEFLTELGYAKASDVAEEIFAEIESKKLFVRDRIGNMRAVVLFEDIAELKKKYTEGEKRDR